MNLEQHAKYRALLKRTGLDQSVFMDRWLTLANQHLSELLRPESSVPAA